MSNSAASICDSGIQLLGSESEMNESMISSNGFEYDMKTSPQLDSNDEKGNLAIPDLVLCSSDKKLVQGPLPVKEFEADADKNNNPDVSVVQEGATISQYPDELISSTHSTFDTENTEIVYRRRIKKTPTKKAPKKRVSFHEDILKNTRTDNIHIEHGFITYKGGYPQKSKPSTRYSWCSQYDNEGFDDDSESNGQYVYRNACSDVLDFGKTDIMDEEDRMCAKYDKSGIFEYSNLTKNKKDFYRCSCSSSSSNSSIESENSERTDEKTDDVKRNYQQAKSNSCDCIGSSNSINNNNNGEIGQGNCYYSEPNIEHMNEFNGPKSVWSKEKKPKSSCLKKTKRNMVYTNVVPEYQLNNKVKKFNVHQLSDFKNMNHIIDNSKMIIGSLKDIFGITLPERGVPEGSEDLNVTECIPPENDNDFTMIQKPKGKSLSKSLDGGLGNRNKARQFVHNVDEQLRRKNDEDLFAPSNNASRKNSIEKDDGDADSIDEIEVDESTMSTNISTSNNYRNKFIINCESTVYEHTGTCFEREQTPFKETLVAEPTKNQFKKKLSSIFKTFADIGANSNSEEIKSENTKDDKNFSTNNINFNNNFDYTFLDKSLKDMKDSFREDSKDDNMDVSIISTPSERNSIISDTTISTNTSLTNFNSETSNKYDYPKTNYNDLNKKSRHLSSPLRKQRNDNLQITNQSQQNLHGRISPDLFNSQGLTKSTLSEEFDDILTITTDITDKTSDIPSDIVIVDYSDIVKNESTANASTISNYYLKIPSIMTSSTTSTASKTSLINRFLRNVTQKKIMEATIKKNNFFQAKLNNEKKLFGGNLYVKGAKPKNLDLIDELNAEIAMEVELSSNNSNTSSFDVNEDYMIKDLNKHFNNDVDLDGGIGELNIDLFDVKNLQILRNQTEILMKAFKLYTGYSTEGVMTPVLVFLTNKTVYVTDLVRSRLCNKFVLPYVELDVILLGPYGNTVLLSNNARDMQQVLLAGGPPADKLVASLEMCARKGNVPLPAVGILTLDHLAPLQSFVCHNSSVAKDDAWKYYAVVNMPASTLGVEKEPLGPSNSGFLMHRRVSHSGAIGQWTPGYFLLKAGVLYLFNDSTHKIPSWAVALMSECQGARRAQSTGRPHCFEILLRTGSLQMAAPDEYIASDWLQALVQAASGLFEMQEKHKTLGCTLIMTSNHLITLREDFSSPLRRVLPNSQPIAMSPPTSVKENVDPNLFMNQGITRKMSSSTILDTSSEVSSIKSNPSTPSKGCRSLSTISTPTKVAPGASNKKSIGNFLDDGKSHTNMSSFYGKNSGIEILTCATLEEMTSIKIPGDSNTWWCMLVCYLNFFSWKHDFHLFLNYF